MPVYRDANLVYWHEVRSSDVQYEQRIRLDQPPDLGDDMLDILAYRAITG